MGSRSYIFNILHKDLHKKLHKEPLLPMSLILFAVILAYSFRLIGRGSFYPTLFSYLRSFIYIGLYAAWGISIRQRIVQKQVGQYLVGVSVLLILWFTFRSAKYFIFWQPVAIRYQWYLFYLPMLFVPMLALLIAMSLGKPDEYKLPKSVWLLSAVSGVLLILVLTNDLHQLVFTFPKDADVWSDADHGYGVCYFAVIAWQVFCAVAALIFMLFKCRLKNGKHRYLPVIPFAISLAYLALNYVGTPWLKHLFGDVTAFQSLMYMLGFEACIACGYIHSNSRYADLFASSVGTSAEITDRDFNIRYAALNIEPISKETMRKAEKAPVTVDGGLTVHTMPIGGGYRYEYRRESKRRKVEEQNRLFDLLQSATQKQINRISALTQEYRRISKSDTDRVKMLLAEIAVLCSYIKRRKHLTLLADRDCKVAVSELERAFSESLQTLKLLNVRNTLYVDSELSMISDKNAAAILDFYEEVIEADLENLTSVQISLANINGLRLSLNACCETDLSIFSNKGNVLYEMDGDAGYQHLVVIIEGGAAV